MIIGLRPRRITLLIGHRPISLLPAMLFQGGDPLEPPVPGCARRWWVRLLIGHRPISLLPAMLFQGGDPPGPPMVGCPRWLGMAA